MKPVNQDQHKIPQVYLKKFGYEIGNQWKLSVLKKGERFTRQKSIGSFTALTNFFDVDSDDPRIPRMFEHLNGNLETEYSNIVSELEENELLSNKSYAFLLQLIANLIVRSDDWRDQIMALLESNIKENFLQIIMGHHCKDEEEFGRMRELAFFRNVADMPPAESINRVLLYFIDHLMLRLWHFEITFIKSQPGKPWCTSTNPVVVKNRVSKFEMFAKESEIYFPVTPEYLAYLHYQESDDKDNILRTYPTNRTQLANDEQNLNLQHVIMDHALEYVIFAGYVNFRNEPENN